MTPTKRMQEIEDIRQMRLKKTTSKIGIEIINEVADALHEKEMKKHKLIQAAAELQNAAS